MQLLIDFREKWFIKKLEECNGKVNGIQLNFVTANLEVGDFVFKNENDEILLVAERKTIRDLSASITDGRFRQQKERLLESTNDHNKVLYIIEGAKGSFKTTSEKGILSQTIIDGSLQNMLFRHHFKLLRTDNEMDTLANLALLFKKINNNEFDAKCAPVAPVKLVSKGDKIGENIFALQLSVIPGISYATALKISEVYKNMKEMIDAYNNKESIQDKEEMLNGVQLTNSKRKLGSALSKRVYLALCGGGEL